MEVLPLSQIGRMNIHCQDCTLCSPKHLTLFNVLVNVISKVMPLFFFTVVVKFFHTNHLCSFALKYFHAFPNEKTLKEERSLKNLSSKRPNKCLSLRLPKT